MTAPYPRTLYFVHSARYPRTHVPMRLARHLSSRPLSSRRCIRSSRYSPPGGRASAGFSHPKLHYCFPRRGVTTRGVSVLPRVGPGRSIELMLASLTSLNLHCSHLPGHASALARSPSERGCRKWIKAGNTSERNHRPRQQRCGPVTHLQQTFQGTQAPKTATRAAFHVSPRTSSSRRRLSATAVAGQEDQRRHTENTFVMGFNALAPAAAAAARADRCARCATRIG